ncbi:MAG: sigma-70 family RNA polymerase sigma factor, partial [Cyanobacteria bacterium]|nr:sigma-70 family RNA polymerase sigma factor [Cyanobacteriota bacterium]
MWEQLQTRRAGNHMARESKTRKSYKDIQPQHFEVSRVDSLIDEFMPLVRSIARRYCKLYPDCFEDLVQVGSIGLLKAIRYYDPDRGRSASFKTLATCYIRGEIRHYLRDLASMVQVPRRLTEINIQVSQIEERLIRQLGRVPTVQELASVSGFSEEDILEAQTSREAKLHYESLDFTLDEEEREQRRSLSETVADRKDQDLRLLSEDREQVLVALRNLGEKTRQIVEFVFFYDLSQKETACVLGIS